MEGALTSIVRNPHFVQIVSFLHVPYTEFMWQKRHPEISVWLMIEKMSKIAFSDGPFTWSQKEAFLAVFADFASQVAMADLRLTYSTDDMGWLVGVLDSDMAKVTLAMMLACASCKEEYLTPGEVAELLGQNEEVWRRKAVNYEIPGTIKKKKGWLIPQSGLRAYGVLLNYHPEENEESEDTPISEIIQ